jgi:putative RecB family exonuclease
VDGGTQLGFDLGIERRVRVTPARLGIWADCPRRYRLTYVDRPAPPRGGPRAASTLGAVVHLALRAVFERPLAERSPAGAAALIDRYWNSEGFRDDEQAARYRARARDWVHDYLAEQLERTDPDEELGVGLERWVSVGTGRVVAEGRVDRIDRRGAELVIVDYKTGARAPTAADAASSPALALYAMATEHTLRSPCTQVELHHLPSGAVAGWRHDAASLTAHLRRAERAADELAAATDAVEAGADPDGTFPTRPAPRCAGCPMRRNCADGRAVGPEAEPWAMLAP